MPFSRRHVLGLGITGAATVGRMPGLGRLAFAADGIDRPLLVIVHLRGGCDSLNLISPANDPDFIATRATDLRVATDGPEAGFALASGPDPNIDFRLHNAAPGLAELYKSGDLAFLHAVGLADSTRSHFVAIDLIEHGVVGESTLARTNTGFLSRYQDAMKLVAPGTAISAEAAPSGEFAASPSALAVSDLSSGFKIPGGPQVDAILHNLYDQDSSIAAMAGRAALRGTSLIDGHLAYDSRNHPQPYQPEHGAVYEPAGDLARPLKTVAQLAKMEIGLQIATVDIGGWDTHENQPGRFRTCVERLSAGISAFYNDMWRYHDRLILVTISEFGRRSNRSNGTDHGRAGVMAVLGGRVAGGRFHGTWPGLSSDKLDEGVDLAVVTDYRRVISEILAQQAKAVPLSAVFPNYQYPGPLGLFKRMGNNPAIPG